MTEPTPPVEPRSPAEPVLPDESVSPAGSTLPAGAAEHLVELEAPPAPARRRRRAPMVVGVVAAFAVLLGGGAYAGARAWYGWDAVEPESVMPAGVLAYARIDLDPGYAQQLKLASLLDKFPKPASGDTVSGVERGLVDLSALGLDYAADVRPWFASRLGVGLWKTGTHDGVTLYALASKDDGAAARALEKARAKLGRDRFGFTVRDGYALLASGGGTAQATAESVRAAAQQHPLASSPAFAAALQRLPGAHTAIAFVDLAATGKELGNEMAATLGGLTAGGPALDGPSLDGPTRGGPSLGGSPQDGLIYGGTGPKAPDLSKLTGTLAASAEAVDDGIDVHIAGTGLAASATSEPDVRTVVDALPRNAIAAGAMPGLGLDGTVGGQLGGVLTGLLFGGVTYGGFGQPIPGPEFDPGTDPNDPKFDPNSIPDKTQLLDQFQSRVTALNEGAAALVTAKSISFAVTASGQHEPAALITAETADATAAGKVGTAAKLMLDGAPTNDIGVDQQGATVRLRIGKPDTAGRLGDSALYREALTGMPA
ncbi:MAG: hypothetical protein AUI14_11825, partial [Actinobacteria bacterium 13_2_20CM_2_71_6]